MATSHPGRAAGVPAGHRLPAQGRHRGWPAGSLITDGYTGYQHLLARLAGIQQCCQHYPDIAVMPMTGADPCCEGEFLMAVSA
jgi:hypothetical protein